MNKNNTILNKEEAINLAKSLREEKRTAYESSLFDKYNIDHNLKSDKDVAWAFAYVNIHYLGWFDDTVRGDKKIVKDMFRLNSHILKYATDELKKDHDFITETININVYALIYASEEIRDNDEIVFNAASKTSYAFEFASDRLKNDKKFVLKLIRNFSFNNTTFQYASNELRKDREVVLEAVRNNGRMLQYVDDTLRKDEEIVLVAIEEATQYDLVHYIHKDLFNNRDFVIKYLKNKQYLYQEHNLPYSKLLEEKCVKEKWKNNKYFILELAEELEITPYLLSRNIKSLKLNKDIILISLKSYLDSAYIDEIISNLNNENLLDKEIAIEIIKRNFSYYEKFGKEIQFDEDVIHFYKKEEERYRNFNEDARLGEELYYRDQYNKHPDNIRYDDYNEDGELGWWADL